MSIKQNEYPNPVITIKMLFDNRRKPLTIKGRSQILGNNIPAVVVIVWIVRVQSAKTVFNRDTRSDDKERVRKSLILPISQFVEGLLGNEHSHY